MDYSITQQTQNRIENEIIIINNAKEDSNEQRIKEKIFITGHLENDVEEFRERLINIDLFAIVDKWVKFPLNESKTNSENLKDIIKIVLFLPIELSIRGNVIFFFENHRGLQISTQILSLDTIILIDKFKKHYSWFFLQSNEFGFEDPKFSKFYFNHLLNSQRFRERILILIVQRFIIYSQPYTRIGAKSVASILKTVCTTCIEEHIQSQHSNSKNSPLIGRKRNPREKKIWYDRFTHMDYENEKKTISVQGREFLEVTEEDEEEEEMIISDEEEDDEEKKQRKKENATLLFKKKMKLNHEQNAQRKKLEEINEKEEEKFQYDPMNLFRKITNLVQIIDDITGNITMSDLSHIMTLFLNDTGESTNLLE
jgi:hypothetical protein